MKHWLAYTSSFFLPASHLVGLYLGGWATGLPLLVAFLLFPILDAVMGEDDDEYAVHPVQRWLLVLWVPAQVASLLCTLIWAPHSGGFAALALLSSGVVTATGGITVAHELMHHKSKLDRALAEVLMHTALYPHFCVEHILGHHKNVATPLDAASSRRGEPIYPYLARTIVGSLASAYRLESARVRRHKVAGLHDRRIRYPLTSAMIIISIGVVISPLAACFFILNGLVAILLLESINYIEHYGLQREKRNGTYEPTAAHHSWNSAHKATNAMLFHLPRHSDHHANPKRSYGQLRSIQDAPQFPFGYPTMVLIALIPPLWFAIIHPRLDAIAGR